MMKSPGSILSFYLLLALFELLAIQMGWIELRHFSKPLLMPVLAYFAWNKAGSSTPFLLAGLFFSWIGDVALMYDHLRPFYFIIGLGAFLVAHILYIISYLKASRKSSSQRNFVWVVIGSIGVLSYGAILLYYLSPTLGALKAPVHLYAGILVLMVLVALSRFGKTNSLSYWQVLSGAIFFMISDSILAINKFATPVYASGIFIMSTYILAQYLIVKGITHHAN